MYQLDATCASGKLADKGRDDTEYHDPPGNKRLSFAEHWARALSSAAALGDAARLAARLAHRLDFSPAVA